MRTSSSETPRETALSKKGMLAGALALAIAFFALYAFGACRSIYVGDSGELVAAAATLGIPHPGGYPLYVLLGHVWISGLPLGSIAFRMSLFSAFWGALAVAGLFVVARRQRLSLEPALLGALLLGLSPSFWSQATIQRVYTLSAFFLVLVIGLAFEWRRSGRIAFLVAAAFAAGLGASNHSFLALVGLAVGIWALALQPSLLRRPRELAACVGAGLLGLLPYLYLPLRSRSDPRLDWGNPETLGRWLDVVLRRDFWHRSWLESPADLLPILRDFFAGAGAELFWAGAVLALLGILKGSRAATFCLLLIAAANVGAMALHGSRSDLFIWHRYYIPAFLVFALLAAQGAEWVREKSPRTALLFLLLPIVMLFVGYRQFDRSRYRIAEDFSRTLLDGLPPGAHLSASDDNILFVLIYLHVAEGLRPDLDLILQGVGGSDLAELRFNPDDDPLFFTHHPNWSFPELAVEPVGLVFETLRSGSPLPELRISRWRLDGEDDSRVPKDYLTRNLIGHFHYMLGISHELRDWPVARRELLVAERSAPENDVLFYNLGLIYQRNGLFRRSLTAFEHSQEINPRHLASSGKVRAADKVAELRSELDRLAQLEQGLPIPPDLSLGSALWHSALARELDARGETLAARGHALLAAEIEARGMALEAGDPPLPGRIL